MATLKEQIEKMETELSQKKEKLKKIEAAQKAAQEKKEKLNDEKKKKIIGNLILKQMNQNDEKNEKWLEFLNKYLEKNSDRVVFGLTEIPPKSNENDTTQNLNTENNFNITNPISQHQNY